MRIVADLHNHSRFSRACSPQLTLPNLDKWAKIKGVNLLTVADFTHPVWIKECEEQLQNEGNGFYTLKGGSREVFFIFTTELAFIYKKNDKTRRVHEIVLAPNLEVAKRLNKELDQRGFNLKSDGRPILGMSDRDFLELIKNIDERLELIPAHIWTPWFSVFGSKSGFDSIEECFEDMSKYIFALETGLSSDPMMNWRISSLDKYSLISNSDSHSLKNIGREANVFEIDKEKFSYDEFIRILKENNNKNFLYTIEFFPEEGRYHYDGHRDCNVVLKPSETIKLKGICPKCKKNLVIGVDYRVEELADRKEGYLLKDKPAFKKMIELDKIIAECIGVKSRESKKVIKIYNDLIKKFGNEFKILIDINPDELRSADSIGPILVEAIKRVRLGKLKINPGYDGVYGEVKIFSEEELGNFKPKQSVLFS